MDIPNDRLRQLTEAQPAANGAYVLYWMTSYRRGQWNYSLQHAVNRAQDWKKPLVVLEALRCDYRWASDRLHGFLLDGMCDNSAFFAGKPVLYYPYVEPRAGAGQGLLAALAEHCCLIVTDDFPCFFLPQMYAAVARRLAVPLELVDGNGLLPMRATSKVFARAVDFRRFLQQNLRDYLEEMPLEDPLAATRLPRLPKLPDDIQTRWPRADLERFRRQPAAFLHELPIDHAVPPPPVRGGRQAAIKTLRAFVPARLERYAADRNQPEMEVTSGLSPYLHLGHISPQEIFAEVTASDGWRQRRLSPKATGSAQGWWGASEPVESFLDQLITWRELGYNMCCHRHDYDHYDSLPPWCRNTLAQHATDRRQHLYTLCEFEQAQTHDPLWNAAQTQLVREGRIHNYLRMLWGKKVLEWSPTPQDALHVLIELNNKYALDGRNPNSYSGIFWCLGRYDRPWGPERPVFGRIRYMSSDNTARKVRVKRYIDQFSPLR